MNSLPEITHLFTKLASDLRPPNSAPASVARAIHSVAASLNDDGDDEEEEEEKLNRRVRVLDAALSLMCFKTPQVPLLLLLLLFPLPFPIFIDLSLSLIAPHFRMLFWYLDPSTLKHDISEILREAIQRPFLCLKKELYDHMAWRSIIICLVTSPTIFMETRALLHRWFLMTGLASVLDLQVGIVSSVLDILSRPMRWGISMELGLQIPFSYAYFPNKHRELLAILNASVSCKAFMGLVCYIKDSIPSCAKLSQNSTSHLSLGVCELEASMDVVDFDSFWSLAMNFPVWFYFAISLLFHGEHSHDYLSKLVHNEVTTEETKSDKLALDAAFYISWILSPINEAQQNMLADHIFQSSRSWVRKSMAHSSFEGRSFSKINYKNTISHSKRLQIPKNDDNGKLHISTEFDSGSNVIPWLREFNSHRIKFCSRIRTLGEGESEHSANLQWNLVFSKIPLGILIMCPNFLNENGCEVLLHYAATGEAVLLKELPNKVEKCAMEGAHLVLNLLDDIEDLSRMFFDCEDSRLTFISQFKGNTCRYLLRCVHMLPKGEDFNYAFGVKVGDAMVDLHMRLVKWKQQGGEDFDGCEALEDVIKELNGYLSLS
ncbi:hypothetical protein ACMD2_16604 [Ananas comosus]|uniref:Uncharacterized protein n=1 Tax=Ananas comosus TaxID=4615 RepID=A0A199W074_ANACO|nr:hypothetical protein ACMD2_16604 [Ananas comosus]